MRDCCLITGASRGIGKTIAITLAQDYGFHILINYASNEAAALETVSEIEAHGGSAELLQFKVQDYEETTAAIDSWIKSNPEDQIKVLVNNAGVTKDNLLVFMEKDDFNNVIDINLRGTYNVTKAVINHMVRKRYGRIINVASLAGVKGVPGQTNYSASKGGMIAFTKSLAQEVAKRKITVNAVAPGFISTDMTKDLPADELKKLIPMNRFGTPEEVAGTVSFLVSEKAAYITGEVININGGIS
ncbi:3-oxoacyl-ACP reductase FabG [uncultured Algoriphagus sp.]|jgi:3-oxoacyl-[acyl-carrier protein] reductase|uniref:3-oxoacyl-ACP reductase FabG n=1 Tax=uncultured Algoriphagus sp. TaxID=417365 RepID=UPI0030EDEE25|tara:strand:+ start:63670 stop:64401 length:732 start_codon:yes stop_codon:yes gene_type:complete